MPRDKRQYITVPLDYYRHPKVSRLSIEAREGFLLLNIEAREAKNDGLFEAADAEFIVGEDVMRELVGSHPLRPMVERVDGGYMIRDFAEHQLDEATRSARAATSRENGSKGGRPKNPNKTQLGSEVNPDETQTEPGGTRTKAESESESESESTTYVRETKRLSDSEESNHGTLIPDDWRPNQQHIDKARSLNLDVYHEHNRFKAHAVRTQRRMKNWNAGFTNWLKQGAVYNQQRQGAPAPTYTAPKLSKAAQNAQALIEFQKEMNHGRPGSMAALDPGERF